MAVLPVLRWPDRRLATVCAPALPDDATRALAADMLDTMYAAYGRGLAAPQVGVLTRVFVMDTTWKEGSRAPRVFLNPEILHRSDRSLTGPEGCLSIPGISADVTRAAEITLRWTDPDGQARQETLSGFAAICAQHEIDHLDGLVTFDRLSPATRAALEAAYSAGAK
ncbi:peptide deformylase [Paragemmobacter straminiformis]|uniref:Peptide deformylase n=1 Tax=Paragemmobacter straminiformis TaxID=2045119 RepID=A0A842ID03_9RHOB|nr:peptide deformylase [Gemmobacter straminiformis]MBC2837515.1 peptide deformylase [Gemmobacter straminiformis]